MINRHSTMTHKTAAALLAALLAIGGPAAAGAAGKPVVTAAAGTAAVKHFPDVAAGYWADPYITRLALMGVVVGDENGRYQPEQAVTREQVVIMVVRMMGLEASFSELKPANIGLEVSGFAKQHVQMALEKGLIDLSEEKTLSGLTGWGTKPASREWVAKLAVMAIGKQAEAQKLGGITPTFTDSGSISVWARGYINEAVALKIVDGMEDGTFRPKDTVTRAQMAAFLSRAGNYAADVPGKTVSGVVDSSDGSTVSLFTEDGYKHTYSFAQGAAAYSSNGAPLGSTVLKANSRVLLILNEGNAVYAQVLEDQVKNPLTLPGTVIEVKTGEAGLQLYISTHMGDTTVDLDPKLTILDAGGKGMKLSDLKEGVEVELKRISPKAKFSTITIQHVPVFRTAEVKLADGFKNDGELTAVDSAKGTARYALAGEVAYWNNGVAGDLLTLRKGDLVRLSLKDEQVVKVEMLTPYVEPTDSGELVDYKTDKGVVILTLKHTDGQYATYKLVPQPEIVVPGMDFTTMKDLLVGDALKLTLTDEKAVRRIEVTNRSMKTEYFDTIVGYDAESKLLTVKTSDGQPRVYQLGEGAVLELSGTNVSLTSAATVLQKGRKVDITASSESQVKLVRLVTGYAGTVLRVKPDANEVSLRIGSEAVTLKTSPGVVVELPNKPQGKLADLAVGDRVGVTYDSAFDGVVKIQLAKTTVYRLTERQVSTKQIVLRDAAGQSLSLTAGSLLKLYNASQAEIGVADLQQDELYYVSYSGSTVISVTAAPSIRGSVLSVDAASGTVSYTDKSGAVQTLSAGADAKVKREGAAAAGALGTLAAGDRFEAVKEADGTYTVRAAAVLNRPFDGYDASSQQINVLRNSLDEPRTYPLMSGVYIHQGSTGKLATQLTRSDTLNLYLLDGRIMEISVQ